MKKEYEVQVSYGLNCVLPNICWSLNPQNQCDLIWKWSVYRCNQAKMRSLGWILTLYDWCPFKKRKMLYEERDMWRSPGGHRGRYWNDVTASQGMPRVDDQHWKLRRDGRGLPRISEGACPQPSSVDFGFLASRAVRGWIYVLSYHNGGNLLQQPQGTNTDAFLNFIW